MVGAAPGDFSGNERFQVKRRIGAGGMGVVYEAFDRERGVEVALKTLRHLSGEALLRFKTEFRALQGLVHPNLVTLGELFEDRGRWFFTMELVEGKSFLEYVRPHSDGARPPDTEILNASQPETPSSGHEDTVASASQSRGDVRAHASGPTFVEDRLRRVLVRIAEGLSALHAAGKVHRDLKPSNILVTRDGRPVILDFGLVADLAPEADHTEQQIVGTTAYMSPEQAASRPVGPPSDWYALGVLLYEALTGAPPFTGAPLSVLVRKQTEDPPPPRTRAPSVPSDLDALCRDLLERNPAARPDAAAILVRLESGAPRASGEVSHERAPFVGRESELAELTRAYEEVAAGGTAAVVVVGESGVGKTALARRFLVEAQRRGALVLFGRCYERETVPFKGIDGIVDAISRHLLRLGQREAASLLPAGIELVAQTFPVLAQVEAVAQRTATAEGNVDPLERRLRVFRAVRELLERLSNRQPIVLVIDDLQWADADSLSLLGEVLRPPRAPRLLLLATSRTPLAEDSRLPPSTRSFSLSGLPPEQARKLVDRLTRGRGSTTGSELIVRETGGHPMFIAELVRHFLHGGAEKLSSLNLDQALWARIELLDPDARAILEVVCVAGAPLPQSVIEAAAGKDAAAFGQAVERLRGGHLVRTSGGRRSDTIEPYHDRVRHAVSGQVGAETKRQLHRRVAVALEAHPGRHTEALALHWHRAGDAERARDYTMQAALDAGRALAFEREATLWRVALDLLPAHEAGERARLLERLGEALINAGRTGEAADALLEAVPHCDADAALELERRAAEQLLRCGRLIEGYELLRRVLASVGMKLPQTPRRAVLALIGQRVRLKLRGLSFRERREEDIEPALLRKIDICWSAAAGLSFVDSIRGAVFQTRQLRLALDAGEPYRVARGLALEAGFAANAGGASLRRARGLADRSLTLAARSRNPHAVGLAHGSVGTVHFHNGRWREARDRLTVAMDVFRDQCTGVAKELIAMQLLHLSCTAMLGDVDDLAERIPDYIRQGRERGDQFATTSFPTGLPNLLWLAAGDPGEARRQAEAAMAPWPEEPFVIQHALDILAQAHIDLYEDLGVKAWERTQKRWPALVRSLLLRGQILRGLLIHVRARTALCAAASAGADAAGYLRAAEKDALVVERIGAPWATSLARLLRAGVASLRQDMDATVRLLTDAAAELEAADTHLYAVFARRRLGQLIGGDEGRAMVERADAWISRRRIKDVEAMTRLTVTGVSL